MKDYILGRRIELTSPLGRDAVEQVMRRNIKMGFNPFYTGVVGWARFGRVGLRWATAMWGNGFQPVFRGKLQSELGTTRLRGRFGAPFYLLIFFGIWYFLLSNMLLTALGQYISDDVSGGDSLIVVIGALGMMAVPLAFHFIFNRNGDAHFDEIIDLLCNVAEFKVSEALAL